MSVKLCYFTAPYISIFSDDHNITILPRPERNRINPMVIRDYRGDEGLKDENVPEHRLHQSSRSFPRADATLSDEASFVTQDSLFDYGAQLSNRSI